MGKKTRDPLAPKPPLNAYMLFAIEERAKVLSDLGEISTTEVGKVIGARWKLLNKDDKEKYLARFRENQGLFKIDKLNYEEKTRIGPKEASPPIIKHKQKKNPLAPKLPLSSYMEFSIAERAKVLKDLGSLSLVDVGRELGRRWKSLSIPEKNVYEVKGRENRVKYQNEMEMFNSQPATDGPTPPATDGPTPPTSAAPSTTETPLVTATDEPAATDSSVATPTTDSPGTSPPPATETSSQPKLEHLGFAKQSGYG